MLTMVRLETVLFLALGLSVSPAAAKPFTWAFNGDALTMDPHASNNTFTNAFVNYMYEGLTRHNYEVKIEPALATSWKTISPTVWRFSLRKGVKFHDGADFDADDVVATWQRMNTPGALVMTVVNPIKDVRKVDSHTVDHRNEATIPDSTLHPHPLLRHGQGLDGEERGQKLDGSGSPDRLEGLELLAGGR